MRSLVIGTRGSPLAKTQSQMVAKMLSDRVPGLSVSLKIIRTSGDKIIDVPLSRVGGKGLFVKEIEEALLAQSIDLAVHSVKDLPGALPPGLVLSAIPKRADPRDALVSCGPTLAELPAGSRVGTCSLRRACQVMAMRPDLEIAAVRGNVETRLRRLRAGDFDAIVLAAAGLARLELLENVTEYFDKPWVYAVGQGALGLETRADDDCVNEIVAQINDAETSLCVSAERSMLKRIGGGCHIPVGGHATLDGEYLSLTGLIGHPSGVPLIVEQSTAGQDQAVALGAQVADRMLARGGRAILDEVSQPLMDPSSGS